MTPAIRKNWVPSIFNDFFDNGWMGKANATAPAINVIESDKDYRIELAAPGMTKNDFNVCLDADDNLVVTMEKKEEKKNEEKHYLRREFSYSKFQQTILLPEDTDKDKISAKVENGVLSVEVPKLEQKALKKNSRAIEVK